MLVEWARDVNISGVENYMLNEKEGMQNCAYWMNHWVLKYRLLFLLGVKLKRLLASTCFPCLVKIRIETSEQMSRYPSSCNTAIPFKMSEIFMLNCNTSKLIFQWYRAHWALNGNSVPTHVLDSRHRTLAVKSLHNCSKSLVNHESSSRRLIPSLYHILIFSWGSCPDPSNYGEGAKICNEVTLAARSSHTSHR